MRKNLVAGILALLGLGGFAVLGTTTPGLIQTIAESVASAMFTKSVSQPAKDDGLLEKMGKPKRASSKGMSVPAERPEGFIWHVVFDFTKKIEAKADEANRQGHNGNLYRNYFIRLGVLSEEEYLALKATSSRYLADVDPIAQQTKKIYDDATASAPSDRKLPRNVLDKLGRLETEKNNITLRHRDELKAALGEDTYRRLVTFLQTDFSEGSKPGELSIGEGGGTIIYYPYSWIIWDDGSQPPLITGFSELYFSYFNPAYYYDPSLDSFFVNWSTQSLLDFGWDTGYRDFFPAQYFHPTFVSIRGHRYCTYTDHYAVLYDGPFLVDTIYLTSTEACHIVGPGPTPTPTATPTATPPITPTPTPPCDPIGEPPCVPTPTPTPTATPTPVVTSVTFSQETASAVPISPNPTVTPHNPGIGQRIFSDDDVPNDPVDRRRVVVSATVSPATPNVTVYFRNFDLDDPATDTTIDPNGLGDDNNGTPIAGTLSSQSSATNATGVATVIFTVTRQPGDNFAIAASTADISATANAVTVQGIELVNAAGNAIPTSCTTEPVCRSQMLTVWRRLHVEVDSMGLGIANRVVGRIATTTRVRVGETRIVPVTASDGNPANLEPNRFESGRFFSNNRSFDVTCNLANGETCNTVDSVTVTNNGGALVTLFAGTPFELYDDDDMDDEDALLNGDEGDNVPEPDITLMRSNDIVCPDTFNASNCNVFVNAYVQPVYDLRGEDLNAFDANVDNPLIASYQNVYFQNRATEASESFWTVYLLGAYQYQATNDGDPSTQGGVLGTVVALNGVGATLFTEVNRPLEYAPLPTWQTRPVSRRFTVAHEIGHLFFGEHEDMGLMSQSTVRTSPLFDPRTINKIRGRQFTDSNGIVRTIRHP